MCWACFKKYTDAPVVNERVQAAYDLIARHNAYDESDTSMLLHVIVADMNVDDRFFTLAGDEDEYYRVERYNEAEQWERDIFDALAKLTEEERATAVAMDWGYISRDGTLRADLTA